MALNQDDLKSVCIFIFFTTISRFSTYLLCVSVLCTVLCCKTIFKLDKYACMNDKFETKRTYETIIQIGKFSALSNSILV